MFLLGTSDHYEEDSSKKKSDSTTHTDYANNSACEGRSDLVLGMNHDNNHRFMELWIIQQSHEEWFQEFIWKPEPHPTKWTPEITRHTPFGKQGYNSNIDDDLDVPTLSEIVVSTRWTVEQMNHIQIS